MGTKSIIIVIVAALFVSAILASLYVSQNRQDLRTQAAGTTVLSFTPATSFSKPLIKKVGEDLSFDIRMDPGTNQVSILKLEINFDPTRFTASDKKLLEINQTVFPTVVEGPIIDTNAGRVAVTLSIGTNTKSVIKAPTTIGKINLRAKKATTKEREMISFSTNSQAFSLSPDDHAYNNVIATAIPAYVYIGEGIPNPKSSAKVSGQPLPTSEPTRPLTPNRTPTPAKTPTPSPTPQTDHTVLDLTAFLHGIGQSGDSVNPTASNLSNKSPLHVGRKLQVALTSTKDDATATYSGMLIYTPGSGAYLGTINLEREVKQGDYIVKVQLDNFLWKRIPDTHTIGRGTRLTMAPVDLVAGDSNNDNVLDILDFNLIMDCYSEFEGPKACDEGKYLITDINDDGFVNQTDYNLFVREITVQRGD